ncbi:TPA: replication initiator protein A [Streptococcus suis]|nr:replication initiator protein A [Streptococcus suis]
MVYGRKSLIQIQSSEIHYQLPKVLVGTAYYQKLCAEAKFLYMLINDRLKLSIQTAKDTGKFVDEHGDVYVIYPNEELIRDTGYKKDKIIKLKKDLIKYHLLDEERQGLRQPNRLYPKNVVSDPVLLDTPFEEAPNPWEFSEVGNSDFKNSEIPNSRSRENRIQEVGNTEPSKNKIIKNYISNSNSSRKSETISDEILPSPQPNFTLTRSQTEKYIQPKYYSLLQTIADRYNGKFCQIDLFTGETQNYHLTHKQKMMIGQYLDNDWVTSQEVLDMIDRVPVDCESPLAYLLKMLENLKTERQAEVRRVAHLNAQRYYEGGQT